MRTVTLGQGLKVSCIGYGAMGTSKGWYGAGPPEDVGIAAVRAALDGGSNVISTASFYGMGGNETLIGKAIKGYPRKDVCIASKWSITSTAPITLDFSAANAHKTINEQLERLSVEFLDVMVVRGRGRMLDQELTECFEAMKEIKAAGKIKHIGVSELPPDQIREAHKITPITLCELEWSLFARDCERELVPTCRELGIGFLAYSPMGKGLLTGQMDLSKLDKNDVRVAHADGDAFYSRNNAEKNVKMAAKVGELAKVKGCTPGQLALAWLLHKGDDVCPIPGTKTPSRVPENLAAADVKLTQQDMAALDAAVQVEGGRMPGRHGLYDSSH